MTGRLLPSAALIFALLLSGCGGGTMQTASQPASARVLEITVTPASASVAYATSQTFSATITGTTNSSVTWSVDAVPGGNSSVGIIDAAGKYAAPSASGSHTITATSQANSSDSGSATVQIVPPVVTVAVTPANASAVYASSIQFAATVTGSSDGNVSWAVDGVTGGNAAVGTITGAGLYTAPSTQGTHIITATSQVNPADSGSMNVQVIPPTVTLTLAPTIIPSLVYAAQQAFTATVIGSTNTAVTWSVDGVAGGNSTLGAITPAGVYIAPSAQGVHTVTAISQVNPADFGSVNVRVVPPVSVAPNNPSLVYAAQQAFTATVTGSTNTAVTWYVDNVLGGNSTTGTITAAGLYTAASVQGTHTITAVSQANPAHSASVNLQVNPPSVTTYHNDNFRSGWNYQEPYLNPVTVTSTTFGQLFSQPVDGYVYAQPLYVPGVSIGGVTHNVVYVATQHCSVYAFDADSPMPALWQTSLSGGPTGISSLAADDVFDPNFVSQDIVPEICITGTSVIDPTSGTLYVVATTKEPSIPGLANCQPSGAQNYYCAQRLHALDIATGQEVPGSPVIIKGVLPGTGIGSSEKYGVIGFSPLIHLQRVALTLSNGTVYIAWASYGDQFAYHGWIMGYDASTLAQVAEWMDTPNGNEGGIWMGGGGLAADDLGNLYVSTGNGTYDLNQDYGESVVKLNPAPTFSVADYFTPFNWQVESGSDEDLGSGGVLLLPDQPGPHVHELLTGGKYGTLYLIDRDNMGQFNSGSDNVVQELPGAINPLFSTPAYFNGSVYTGAIGDLLRRFSVQNGLLSLAATTPEMNSAEQHSVPASSPYTITVTNSLTFHRDLGVIYASGSNVGQPLFRVASGPTVGQYSVSGGVYTFAVADTGVSVNISYTASIGYPGATPSISSMGNFGGIVWALDNGAASLQGTAILYAFDATTLQQLYSSSQNPGRDAPGPAVKFTVPTVANGKVYVGTENGLAVYGLLP